MPTVTFCDKCNKKQKEEEVWYSVRISTSGIGNYIKNLETSYLYSNYCSKCGENIIDKILKITENKNLK